MTNRKKIFVLIFVITGLIAAFWVISSQLNMARDAVNQAIEPGLKQEAALNTLESVPVAGMAISVVGAAPVEQVKKPVEKIKEKIVFQSESQVSGSQSPASAGSSATAAISVKKEPTPQKRKEMSSKGIIIF